MVEKRSDFMSTVDEAIARNVKAARERAGLSQADLASRLTEMGVPGIYQTTIARIENNQRVLRVAEALALGRLLDYQVEELVESHASISLRWEYEKLQEAVEEFEAAARQLMEERLHTADSLDHKFPYGAGGWPSDGDVLSVNPTTYNLIDELLSANSEPMERIKSMYFGWRRDMAVVIEPFKRSRRMDLYEEVVLQGYGALRTRDFSTASDDEFERDVLIHFGELVNAHGEHQEAP